MSNTEPEEPYVSQWEIHEDDQQWMDEGDSLYEDILNQLIEDYGSDVMDQHAADLLYEGWFDAGAGNHDEIWFDFFDYTGIEWEDFPWEEWREWYGG